MRYLDIALAAMVGTAALAGLSVWSPTKPDAAALSYRETSALRDRLLSFVDRVGVPFLASAPVAAICAATSTASNSTMVISADIGGIWCALPPTGPVSADLTFRLGNRQVILESWSGAAA